MNINKTGLPLATHRKKSVSFRDKSLLQIFQVGMQTLGQLVSGSYGQMNQNQVHPAPALCSSHAKPPPGTRLSTTSTLHITILPLD
jgi:hypothetical protein